jgi:phage head maturation protease
VSTQPRWWIGSGYVGRPPRTNLVRSHDGATVAVRRHETAETIQARESGSTMTTLPVQMTGHFAVTGSDQWAEIQSRAEGHFLERIAAGSFRRTMAEDDIKVMFQHGKDPFLGERPLGVIRSLAEDSTGARYVVDLFETIGVREILPALATNTLRASFRFSVRDETWRERPGKSAHNPRGLPERTIKDARVIEFGPVVLGAYRSATAGLLKPGAATAAASKALPAPRARRVPESWRLPVKSNTLSHWRIYRR